MKLNLYFDWPMPFSLHFIEAEPLGAWSAAVSESSSTIQPWGKHPAKTILNAVTTAGIVSQVEESARLRPAQLKYSLKYYFRLLIFPKNIKAMTRPRPMLRGWHGVLILGISSHSPGLHHCSAPLWRKVLLSSTLEVAVAQSYPLLHPMGK